MSTFFDTLWSDESGQDLVEYVLILVLIAIAAIVAMSTLGGEINQTFKKASDVLGDYNT